MWFFLLVLMGLFCSHQSLETDFFIFYFLFFDYLYNSSYISVSGICLREIVAGTNRNCIFFQNHLLNSHCKKKPSEADPYSEAFAPHPHPCSFLSEFNQWACVSRQRQRALLAPARVSKAREVPHLSPGSQWMLTPVCWNHRRAPPQGGLLSERTMTQVKEFGSMLCSRSREQGSVQVEWGWGGIASPPNTSVRASKLF